MKFREISIKQAPIATQKKTNIKVTSVLLQQEVTQSVPCVGTDVRQN